MKSGWIGLVLAGALATTARADAFCGFYVSGGDTKLYNNATQVVLMREGTRTALSMANNYEGPAENFAMVVPVPVILQKENVKTLPKALFDKIDQLDAPRLVEYWEQDPCWQPPAMEGRAKGGAPSPMPAPPVARAESASLGVTVEAKFTVGEYDIAILSAKYAAGLDTWLKQEKYKIPEGSEPYFKPYIAAGSKFFVAKVDASKVTKDGKGHTMLSPLRFHYDSEQFALPVRLGLVNSKGTQDLIVHVLAKGKRYEVANYPNVTIPTNLDVAENARDSFGSFYAALFDSTVAKTPKSVVTEYSWDSATCDPCPGPTLDSSDLATLGADVMGPDVPATPPTPPKKKPPTEKECSPPWTVDANGVRHYKKECLGDDSAPPPVRVPPRNYYGYTLTRLHARYTKESLGEDLVFKEAGPITGGREVMKPSAQGGAPELEHGAVPAQYGGNNFQGRYAIRHPWTGPIACKDPRRNVWGGPPAQYAAQAGIAAPTQPKAAKDLAFVPRDTPLPSFMRSEIPELGVKPSGATPSGIGPAGSASATPDKGAPPSADADAGTAKPTKTGGCAEAPNGGSGAVTAVFAALVLSALRRKKRKP